MDLLLSQNYMDRKINFILSIDLNSNRFKPLKYFFEFTIWMKHNSLSYFQSMQTFIISVINK